MKVTQKQYPCHTEMRNFHVLLRLVNLFQSCWLVEILTYINNVSNMNFDGVDIVHTDSFSGKE